MSSGEQLDAAEQDAAPSFTTGASAHIVAYATHPDGAVVPVAEPVEESLT